MPSRPVHIRRLHIVRTCGNDDECVLSVAGLKVKALLINVETAGNRVVHRHTGHIKILQADRKLGGFEFNELHAARIFRHVMNGSFALIVGLEFNDASLLEQNERASAVGRIIWNGDFRIGLDVIQ